MASSEEEGEIIPGCINNYYFINDKSEPVSLSILPLLWRTDEIKCHLETKVYLRGASSDGLQEIYKQIIAWKFDLSYAQPIISVLSRDKNWITLERPRKNFESTIRTLLVTIYFLFFVRRNPWEFRMSVWKHIVKVFSSFDVKPSEDDVQNHLSLIRDAAERDKDLAKSEYLLAFINNPQSNEVFHEDVLTTKKSKFIVDSEEDGDDSDGDEFRADEGHHIGSYDTVCAICDNDGEILLCEGKCLRSFHATMGAGLDSFCESLGYSITQVHAIPNFFCANCKYQQHQCFACGKLGSSDESSNAEVFCCITANCGHYYHPECIAKLLSFGVDNEEEEIRKRVAAGKTFICPLHICSLCWKGENKNVHDLQFAMCRRCPKAYHRKCLPREIAFKSDFDKGIDQRAWEGLLDHRILMYCMDHEIVKELGTPLRNHLVFPDMEGKEKKCTYDLLLGKEKVATSSRKSFEDTTARRTSEELPHQFTKASSTIQSGSFAEIMEKRCSEQDLSLETGLIRSDAARKFLKDEKRSVSSHVYQTAEKKSSLKYDNFSCSSILHPDRSPQKKYRSRRIDKTILEKPMVKKVKTSHQFANSTLEKRILSLVEESTSAFEEEEFKRSQVLATNSCFSQTALDKNLTEGKVEGSVKAIQTALQKLKEGSCIEDAKAICEPGILYQVFTWQFSELKTHCSTDKEKRQIKVILAPFLHGMRYTSFGRHFTKIEKLNEIVDRLHRYVQNGDTVVDFCCGSNDFSCLMKSKLEKIGKSCSFRNYDIFQTKNDFSFEKRDWMSVNLEELPNGSQLIMGLNPPFGVRGFLANKFINKALTFKPKLLILIVPKVTKRLDRKKGGYDLIWEDDKVLSGKSFYLPGSVDTRDKQMEDWNLKPPPLYLWSRPDWTARHMEIARRQGHACV